MGEFGFGRGKAAQFSPRNGQKTESDFRPKHQTGKQIFSNHAIVKNHPISWLAARKTAANLQPPVRMNPIQKVTLGALALTVALFAQSASAQPATLTGTSYSQNFNGITNGLPDGWYVMTGATPTYGGNVVAFITTNTDWASTAGKFGNYASVVSDFGTNFVGNESFAAQNAGAITNRALGVRTTSAFGDPGAAFVFQILNTTNFAGFQLALDGLLLSPQGRSNIWTVDYGIGSSPSSFTPMVTFTNPASPVGVFGAKHQTFSFGTALDHQFATVWIRVANLTAAGGGGSDPTFAIDNFNLTYTYSPVMVTNPPTIPTAANQPQNQTNNAGTTADFVVNATGTYPLVYQWYTQDGTQLGDFGNILGSATAHLQIANVTIDDANGYYVVITNNAPANNVITSVVATLTVIDPAITTQPNNRTNVVGDTGVFNVNAAGEQPLSFQWLFNGTNLIDYGINSSLNVTNLQATNQGAYSVIVYNGYGTAATSAVANLTIKTTPSTRLVRWDFNATNTLDPTAPVPSFGSGTAALVGGDTNAYFAAGTYSDPAGPPGAANSGWDTEFYPTQGTSNKQYGVQFNVSTLGYKNVLVTWEQNNSTTASEYARLQYTTNGTDWVDGEAINMSVATAFEFMSSDLSAIPGVSDNPNFAFRLVAEWESTAIGTGNANYDGTTGTYEGGDSGGSIQYDLVTVFGDVFIKYQRNGTHLVLSWTDPGSLFSLQSAPFVTGTYTNISGATSPYTSPISGSASFFRLAH
jgi:hypothetical protein